MSAVWFVLGILTAIAAEVVACVVYAMVEVHKGGKK